MRRNQKASTQTTWPAAASWLIFERLVERSPEIATVIWKKRADPGKETGLGLERL